MNVNKTLLASALCMCMALPSYADIASGASSATCDNSTIGATEGNTDLEANWNANTITIDWYNGDTKITTNTCSYDGAVTIPATPTKAGYTFNGWHVRVAAPARTSVSSCASVNNEQDCNNSYVFKANCINGEDANLDCMWAGSCILAGTCSGGTND